MALYSEKIGVRNGSQTMWDSFQTLTLMQKKPVFHSFWNPSMCTHARVCIRIHEACARRSRACMRIHMYAYTCSRVSVTFIFQK